jgi:pilus assembly protein CpaD
MELRTNKPLAMIGGVAPLARTLLVASTVLLIVAGCESREDRTQVAGWSLVDPSQRHPILVSQEPATISFIVPRAARGLSPHQRAQLVRFLDRYQSTDGGNSKLVIEAPSGAGNEISSMQAVAEIRHMMASGGIDPTLVSVEAHHAPKEAQAPVRVTYLRYNAAAPECAHWPSNLASSPANLNYANLGCATQHNFAAMVANPADLVEPRTMTPNASERRNVIWDKYTKGQSTISQKQDDEKVKVQGASQN